MKRFRSPGGRPPVDLPEPPTTGPHDWRRAAFDEVGTWLRVDGRLRVAEASRAARELFENPALPSSLVSVTRTVALEDHARRGLAGESGPWQVEAGHFRRALRVSAVPLGDDGVLLVLQDITELLRAQAMRADFVANLAHELRTPVASLSLAAETLSTGLPAQDQARFIARIAEETHYIEGLLKSVTELALLESEVRLSITEFDLGAVVEESWRRVCDRQGAATLVNHVESAFMVRADRVRVAQILQNLLENAHRFTPPGEPVEVGARARAGAVETWVRDHGPGIPPGELTRVFERFYKVDRARTRRGDGSGLGLAITKHLVSAHGGSVSANVADGGGTVVAFEIPLTHI